MTYTSEISQTGKVEDNTYDHLLSNINKITEELQTTSRDLVSLDIKKAIRDRSLTGVINSGQDLGDFAFKLWSKRLERLKILPGVILGEPGWDMLLFLFAEQTAGRETIVKSIAIASGSPFTTALRWIAMLEENDLIRRTDDPTDRRRQKITLTDVGYHKMAKLLLVALGLNGQADQLP